MLIRKIKSKSLLSSSHQPDSWFGIKYNMNLYRGCQHRCIYCDSRSECYGIENFDQEILIKSNAINLLEKELSSKRIVGTIGFGAMNDPYMPIENQYKLTRQALKIIAKYNFPIHLLTKNKLVLRDIDLIEEISAHYAAISFTITTADDKLASIIEPYSSSPSERFSAIKTLSEKGIYTGIVMMPILPFLEDNVENISQIIEKAHQSGAKYIVPSFGMTLRDRQRTYYYEKLDEHFPGLSKKYHLYFGDKYSCDAKNHLKLSQIFYSLCKKYNISTKIKIYKPHKNYHKNINQLKLI